ncbi:putative dipeptidase [uncultured Sphingopyxis sp.]|uniref:Putative dipeptidase n=1 Tax=uncultured Sphingopyxis sp. TaxID=310581 RepID=A0A1Y5PU78_9SPHN|nr:membrane dipeptidase [uncultured Sphingopyxis sp.]SBV33520.1 putative dipeptidase [uncultured Sphingopyxis sp.]
MTGSFRMTRRAALAGAVGAALSAPMVGRGAYAFAAAPAKTYSRRAVDLVASSLVIDMLAPLKITMSPDYVAHRLTDAEAAAFRASGITGFHNAYGIGGPDAKQQALEYLAGWQGFAGRNSHVFTLVDGAADLDRAKADRKCAVIMGIQNAEQFESVEDVALFRRLGLRCAQLTYNTQNMIGSGSTERVDGGVSDYGAAIVAEMEKQKMLVDVSHCGDRTTLDAIEIAKGPIAITHSNARALVDHPRVKTDEAILALAAKGGVMGITGVRMFVRTSDPTNVGHMADHIDHVAKLVGIDHVGIGSDADLNGYDDMPPQEYALLKQGYKGSYAFRDKIDIDGFDHPLKTFDLVEELIRRNYSNDNIRAVLGGNFRRLLGQVWG